MPIPRILLLLPLAAVMFSSSARAQEEEEKSGGMLTPAEILKMMEVSPISYKIIPGESGEGPLADPWSTIYPRRLEPIARAVVVESEGVRTIERHPIDAETREILAKAEERFAEHDARGAREHYRKALDRDPKNYETHAYLGDTYIMDGDPLMALTHYDTAVGLNPDHYQPHFFRASALYRMGRSMESREEFVKALARNPHHASSLGLIAKWQEQLHVDVVDSLLTVGAVAFQEADGVHIVYDPHAGTHWMMYAMAKALWLGEPEHRRQLTGDTAHAPWSMVEERECIGAMLVAYAGVREEEEAKIDPELERLMTILKEGYFSEFLLYELASRVDPQIMMKQSPEALARMEEFVAKYVLVRRK